MSLAAVPKLPLMRLSVSQYHRMRDAGILEDGANIELLDGLLVPKMTKNPPRRLVTYLVRDALAAVVGGGWYVDSQEPVTTDDSEPEPDVCVVAGDPRDYAGDEVPVVLRGVRVAAIRADQMLP